MSIEFSPIDSDNYVRFLAVHMPIVGLRLLRLTLNNRDIRGSHLTLLNSSPFVHNGCLFHYKSSGVLHVRVRRQFLDGLNNVMRIVFVTSVQRGVDYECRDPRGYVIENERVLGYVVLYSRFDVGVWTKPFDLSRKHHIHNFLFDDTVAFIHVPLASASYFFSEWQLYGDSGLRASHSILFTSRSLLADDHIIYNPVGYLISGRSHRIVNSVSHAYAEYSRGNDGNRFFQSASFLRAVRRGIEFRSGAQVVDEGFDSDVDVAGDNEIAVLPVINGNFRDNFY